VTLSATWAGDPLARDIVYMGLEPKAMPRVNVNLPAAPKLPPGPAARVGNGAKLEYLLYVKNGANWDPVGDCDQSATSCHARLGTTASLYVIAVNTSATPPTQTPQLFGCYPSTSQCGG